MNFVFVFKTLTTSFRIAQTAKEEAILTTIDSTPFNDLIKGNDGTWCSRNEPRIKWKVGQNY